MSSPCNTDNVWVCQGPDNKICEFSQQISARDFDNCLSPLLRGDYRHVFLPIVFPIFKSSALYGNTLVSLVTDWPLLTMTSHGAGGDDDDRDLWSVQLFVSSGLLNIYTPGGVVLGLCWLHHLIPTEEGDERSFPASQYSNSTFLSHGQYSMKRYDYIKISK